MSQQPIELLTLGGGHTGIFIISERHTPNPQIEIDTFTSSLGQLQLQYPAGMGGGSEQIVVGGPTTVHVNIPPNGQAS